MGATFNLQSRPHRFKVEAFRQMVKSGWFSPDDRVELIEGVIYDMPPIGPEHASIVDFLHELLVTQCAGQVLVRSHNPLQLNEHNELYPDLAVLKRRQDRYYRRTPIPEDVLLIIEVGHTTWHYDQETKLPLYKQAGIPEIWLIDVNKGLLLTYIQTTTGYAIHRYENREDVVVCSQLPGVAIWLSELFLGSDNHSPATK